MSNLARVLKQKMQFVNILFGVLLTFISFLSLANEGQHAAAVAETSHEVVADTAKHAEAAAEEEKFDAGKLILHHIADEHDWHLFTVGHFHATIPLPCIVYTESKGLEVFMSSNFVNEHHEEVPYNGFVLEHGKIHAENGEKVWDISITKKCHFNVDFSDLITFYLHWYW